MCAVLGRGQSATQCCLSGTGAGVGWPVEGGAGTGWATESGRTGSREGRGERGKGDEGCREPSKKRRSSTTFHATSKRECLGTSRCGLIVPGLKSRIGFHLAGFSGLMRGRNAPRRGRSSDLPGLTTVGPAPIRALLSFSVGSSAFLPSAITRSSTSPIQVPTQPPLCAHLHNCTAHETAV